MKTALHAVLWDVLFKSRSIFFTVTGLLVLAGLAALDPLQLNASAAWSTAVERMVIMSFLISIFLGYAPFTFAESSGGWRMNSVLTRWFVLPMRTAPMVFLPLLAGCLFMTTLIAFWMPILNRLAPGLDGLYFGAVLMAGLAALNALAWTVPRRPLQFWVGAGALFPVVLILALAPQDTPNTEQLRSRMLVPLGVITLALGGYAWFAASRNRCGTWPGELRLDFLWRVIRGSSGLGTKSYPAGPRTAMFYSESLPGLRLLGVSWLVLLGIVFIWVSLVLQTRRPDLAFNWRVLPLVGMGILPVLAIIWLAVWGIFAASDPNSMFRARLSPFRATLPVSSGLFAGERIFMLFIGWLIVWLPIVFMSYAYTPELTGIPVENREYIQSGIARLMAVSAYLAVGALPLVLWGRLEGFGNFLLAGVCAWAVCWGLVGQLRVLPEELPGWRWVALGCLLAAKFLASGWAFVSAQRQGHTSWRYGVLVWCVWCVVAVGLMFVLPTWKAGGTYECLYLLFLLPLARLAWSPLAIAANRHR